MCSGTIARRRTDWREQSRGRGEDGAVHLRRVFRRDGRVFAGSRGHPRQRFSTSHGTPGRRERRAGSSGAARACGGPCASGALARARAARTPRGGRRRHTRGCGRQAHLVVERTIKGVAFRLFPPVARRVQACGCRTRNAQALNARVVKTANAWRCRTRLFWRCARGSDTLPLVQV